MEGLVPGYFRVVLLPHRSRKAHRSSTPLPVLHRETSGVPGLAVSRHLLIESEHRDDQLVVSVFGELDLDSASILRRQVLTAAPGRTIINLRGLTFIDSGGLKLLLEAQERALANGHRLYLRLAPRQVHHVLEATDASAAESSREPRGA
jgi:anti-anti-sigma factor